MGRAEMAPNAMTADHWQVQLGVWRRCNPPNGSRTKPWWGPGGEALGSPSSPAFYSIQKWVKNPHFPLLNCERNQLLCSGSYEFYSHGNCAMPPPLPSPPQTHTHTHTNPQSKHMLEL